MSKTQLSHGLSVQAYKQFEARFNAMGYTKTLHDSSDLAYSLRFGFQPNVTPLPIVGTPEGPSSHYGWSTPHSITNQAQLFEVRNILTHASDDIKLSHIAGFSAGLTEQSLLGTLPLSWKDPKFSWMSRAQLTEASRAAIDAALTSDANKMAADFLRTGWASEYSHQFAKNIVKSVPYVGAGMTVYELTTSALTVSDAYADGPDHPGADVSPDLINLSTAIGYGTFVGGANAIALYGAGASSAEIAWGTAAAFGLGLGTGLTLGGVGALAYLTYDAITAFSDSQSPAQKLAAHLNNSDLSSEATLGAVQNYEVMRHLDWRESVVNSSGGIEGTFGPTATYWDMPSLSSVPGVVMDGPAFGSSGGYEAGLSRRGDDSELRSQGTDASLDWSPTTSLSVPDNVNSAGSNLPGSLIDLPTAPDTSVPNPLKVPNVGRDLSKIKQSDKQAAATSKNVAAFDKKIAYLKKGYCKDQREESGSACCG